MSPSAIASFEVAAGWTVGRLVTWTFIGGLRRRGCVFCDMIVQREVV